MKMQEHVCFGKTFRLKITSLKGTLRGHHLKKSRMQKRVHLQQRKPINSCPCKNNNNSATKLQKK